ncbi:MBL fold metallo-hydrolase [Nonomuraea typhae]|uniref:MBL fold metallo-hydrolase n=1 Tax=Nonomuraea typhae TaxID=2603600 RepID=A0ABW7ZAR2_9ACTN
MRIRYVSGPTAILELAGLRLLTDPTFDEPGHYAVGSGLTKTAGPGVALDEIGPIDAVLLSHDQHPDNLDTSGRKLLDSVPLVLSTQSAADRIGVTVLPNWAETQLGPLTIIGVPAVHGPPGTEHLVGEVTGFVLRGDGLPTVYVSGDNASLDVVREIAGRIGRVDVALLFAGGARTPLIPGADLTLNSRDAAEAARILGAGHVVPLHFEHWTHFTQGRETLAEPFAGHGGVHVLTPGEHVDVG